MQEVNDHFGRLYTANYKRSFMLVKHYVHDEAVAEDIVVNAMIKLWQLIQNQTLDSEEAMLFTMLRNDSLNYLKHKQIEKEVLDKMSDAAQRELDFRISMLEDFTPSLTTLNEINELVGVALSHMPSFTRQIFEMSRYENRTNKEIAEQFNISIKTVEYHITKSIAELRKYLKDYLPINLWPFILYFI